MMGFSERVGSLDSTSPAPLYRRLQALLRQAIQSRTLPPDEALPAERDLAEEFAVSRITVRKALDGLVGEGLLIRRQGAGTFVSTRSRVEKSFSMLTSFTEDMISRGFSPSSAWISRAEGTVNPEESLMLGLSPGSPVYRFTRIRYADGAPMALEHSTVPAFCLSSPRAVDASLYEALEQNGYRPSRALQRLRAVLFTDEQAELLDISPRDAGLLIERRGYASDGRAVEVTQSYYRGDAYDFVAELNTLS